MLAVGPRLWGDEERSDVATKSADILATKSRVVDEMKRLGSQLPPVLVVTNPVEPIVTWLWRRTGLAPNRLFGLGATVDSARFSLHIGSRLDVSARSAWTTLVGEHGPGVLAAGHGRLAGIVPPIELERAEKRALVLAKKDARIIRKLTEQVAIDRAGKLVRELEATVGCVLDKEKRKTVAERLAQEIAPPATRFAIAAAVTEIGRAIHADERRVMTVSSSAPAQWGLAAVALALPFRIGKGAVGSCLLASPPGGLADIADNIEQIANTLP
ncbi:MAG: hypothetical protein DRI90_10630 [Deltaproteobacteria bacterium]|nr:MAG: hypothetical protein DRI90_10630 [Deltaproteobacteria bacterium]